MSEWIVTRSPKSEQEIRANNSIFTICNGYMALKGNLLEHRESGHPSTFLAGVFDEADMIAFLRPTKEERRYLDPDHLDAATPSPSIANLPDPLFVRVFIDDHEISFTRGQVERLEQRLDMRTGVYRYECEYVDADTGGARIIMERACDMENVHRAAMRYALQPLGRSSRIRIRIGIDGSVRSSLQGDRQFTIRFMDVAPGEVRMHGVTPAFGIDFAIEVASRILGGEVSQRRSVVEHERVYEEIEIGADPDQEIVIEKLVAMTCSQDRYYGVSADVQEKAAAAADEGFDAICERNRRFWDTMWDRADVRIEGDDRAQQYLRFCIFHLVSAAPRHTDKLSVACKLLSGEHYQGSTFYDTDLYIEPFYVFTFPEIARAMLNYRHLGLEPGRAIAESLGYRGAKLAWQSGPKGGEVLGRWWRFTHTNIHIDADVAHSLMLFYHATGDEEFLIDRGIDILVESSRFYASRAYHDESSDRYGFRNVAGPDEGHCESTNNFYTNLLAAKTMQATCDLLERYALGRRADYDRIRERLRIDENEPGQWREIASKMVYLFDEQTRLYEQCEGFFDLPLVPPDLLEERKVWFVTVHPYQAMNQPDVVMALVLHRHEFDDPTKRTNWEYYKDKSMNFSSMSYVVNAIMEKEVGDIGEAYRNFLISAGYDLDPTLAGRGDTAEGLHGTAFGGAWMAAVFGFGGVTVSEQGLSIDPRLPEHWKSLSFKLQYRQSLLDITITHQDTRVAVSGQDLSARIYGREVTLAAGAAALQAAGDDQDVSVEV
jgi:kojibiose phosphorylase